jgi:hypothetical protein
LPFSINLGAPQPTSNDVPQHHKGHIMTIDSISPTLYVAPSTLTQSLQPSSQVNSKTDQDEAGNGAVHRGHKGGHKGGGGQVKDALMQALQSMGLSMPQPTTGASAVTATSGTTSSTGAIDSDGDSDGSTSATSSVKKDMGQFMHALFQAVKNEAAAGSSTAGATSTDPKANFAAGLSALISQASSGSAPAELQSAFAKLAADLTQIGSTSTSASSTSSGSSSSSSGSTLQALLTQLQQNLGYGASSSSAAIGNLLTTQA